ncbi:DUF6891 domain-containing protein [Microbacterium sp. P06]|uniref:DUF6891 domain-containing protein n=1 Tax=Microbacterium sp. P06 TaxID=3366949 RepID=UPI003744C3BD
MSTDALATEHWRSCLLPQRLRAPENAEAAAFFTRTYARDLLFAGYVSEEQARPVVHAYAAGVGLDADSADRVLVEVAIARRAETAAGPGSEAAFAEALDRLRADGVAVRVGIDCCRDTALQRVEGEHAEGDRSFAIAGLDDLLKVARAGRIDLSFSYLDSALAGVLTPELNDRAAGGDAAARTFWLQTVDDAEITAGNIIASAMREAPGLSVEWNGTAQDVVSVSVPEWRRPLP